ncbi:MAG: histidine kinase [Cypionkella sp.]|jgi:Ca2+-binding EF-hand superfamily protein|nr:histidine kinase [Cypionkella sp.]
MIDTNKWVGATLVALGFALAGSAALADRMGGMGGGMPMMDFTAMDADKDGKVTEAELTAHRAAQIAAVDSDGDGFLTAAELAAAHVKAATERAEARATQMIEHRDADGDGKLSAAEMTVRPMPARLFERLDADQDGALTEAELAAARDRMQDARGEGGRGKHRGHHGNHDSN